jgi:hypothetical protein
VRFVLTLKGRRIGEGDAKGEHLTADPPMWKTMRSPKRFALLGLKVRVELDKVTKYAPIARMRHGSGGGAATEAQKRMRLIKQ